MSGITFGYSLVSLYRLYVNTIPGECHVMYYSLGRYVTDENITLNWGIHAVVAFVSDSHIMTIRKLVKRFQTESGAREYLKELDKTYGTFECYLDTSTEPYFGIRFSNEMIDVITRFILACVTATASVVLILYSVLYYSSYDNQCNE